MAEPHVQADFALMQEIEIAVARNLQDFVTAYHHVAPHAGAACTEVAGGVAAFTGIDSPLTTVKGIGSHLSRSELDEIEAFFVDHDVATVTVEMAPWLNEESKQILSERGYGAAGHEDVVATVSGGPRSRAALRAEAIPLQAWPEVIHATSELLDESPLNALVIAAADLPNAQLYGLRDNDRWIACAQSVTYDDVVIFGNDATLPEARRRGAQTALIEERLHAVPPGKILMAEVASGSGSERNYLRCGFQIAYTRTNYVRTVL